MNQDQQRADFEALFPMPENVAWVQDGYVVTPYGDWKAINYCHKWNGYVAALASSGVQALRHDLEQYVGIASELATENEALRVALEMIAGMRPYPDSLMGNADIARAALAAMEKTMSEIKITVEGPVGSGKSALLGEIEILCKAIGIPVRYADPEDAASEKAMTHADWAEYLEMYEPSVVLQEKDQRVDEADRQANKTLMHYMSETIAALKATGCDESLVTDIEKAMRGEADRQARGNADASSISGEPFAWATHHDEPMLFPTLKEASTYCDDDEEPIPLFTSPQPQQQVGEPVGEVFTMEPLDGSGDVRCHALLSKPLPAGTKLYTTPQPQQIPKGFKLVPVEPTQEMLDAAYVNLHSQGIHTSTWLRKTIFRLMLEAAPEPKGRKGAKTYIELIREVRAELRDWLDEYGAKP